MSVALADVLPWALSGSPREQRLYVLTLALLVVGSGLALLALRWERIDVLAGFVAGGAVAGWLLSTAPAEGRTLLVLLPGNGVTTADLLAVPVLVVVAVLVLRRLRRRPGGGS